MVCSKKGGIIIESKNKNVLLNKKVIILSIAMLGITIFSNTLYAENSTGTKERVKNTEIKFAQEININKLIRNKENKIDIRTLIKEEEKIETVKKVSNYQRENYTTSRGEVNRTTKTEQKYTKLKDVKVTKNMDITQRTGLSKEDFKKLMKNLKSDKSKFFYRNAETIYNLCEKYEINEIFFCGLIAAESGWNIAGSHRTAHNYISLMANGKLIKYSSEAKGLEVAAKKLHQNYLTPGGKYYNGKTILGVQKKFCPASSTWDDLVYGCMKYVVKTAKNVK